MNAITKELELKMNKLANGFAKERVDSLVENVKELVATKIENDEDRDMVDRALKQLLGKMLAISFAKGYADAREGVQQRTLIVPGGFKS